MTVYAIGDIQGCYGPFRRLLDKVQFDPTVDVLWSAGDLVNRGPESLEVLRFCRSLGDRFICTLGNHDLHFLARAHGKSEAKRGDTLEPLLNARDLEKITRWLLRQKLFHYDPKLGYAMAHAGVHPHWDVTKALRRAAEVETALQGENRLEYFANMYGNTPSKWSGKLEGYDRLRAITNYFTRMRFCRPNGRLDLKTKTGSATAPTGYFPWFELADRKMKDVPLVFGHWASLKGETSNDNVFALDTGCIWGGKLTLMNLSDGGNTLTTVRP